MTLTVRPRGKLLPPEGETPAIDVTAVVWSDRGSDAGPGAGDWGGIIEAPDDAAGLRARIAGGQTRYRLRLEDGREGVIEMALSEFEADGTQPIKFSGAGPLARR